MLRLWTFGGLALASDHGLLHHRAARPQPLALLAILSRAPPTGITRDRLISILWPAKDTAHAQAALRQTLYSLHRALGVRVVQGTWDLHLDHSLITSDVAAFQAAIGAGESRTAAELYRGPFLDGFHLQQNAEFDRWLDRERADLQRAHWAALETLAAEAASDGDWAGAAARWQRRAEEDPGDGRVVASLMRSLVRSGNRAAALRWARAHRHLSREELGLPSDPVVEELAVELRRGEAAGRP